MLNQSAFVSDLRELINENKEDLKYYQVTGNYDCTVVYSTKKLKPVFSLKKGMGEIDFEVRQVTTPLGEEEYNELEKIIVEQLTLMTLTEQVELEARMERKRFLNMITDSLEV